MAFTQTMTVQAASPEALAALLDGWHREQHGVAPGYQTSRLLADQDRPGRYVIEVNFSSEEEARRNNDRPETRAWAQKLQQIATATPEYANFAVAHRTG